jgi:PAS domain S-box-containing protein
LVWIHFKKVIQWSPQAEGYGKKKDRTDTERGVKEQDGQVMKDMKKTKAQLVGELKELRRRVSGLEAVQSKGEDAGTAPEENSRFVAKNAESSPISGRRGRDIIESLPVSIWIEDFSRVREAMEALKLQGVTDLRKYFREHPDFLRTALEMVRIVHVNRQSLKMFGARDKDELMISLSKVFLPETLPVFAEELVALAEGRTAFQSEASVQTLQGEKKNILLSLFFPEEQSRLNDVLVTIMDITQRKKAEAAMQTSQALLDKTFASLEEVVFVVDRSNRRVVACNSAVEKVFGYSVDEPIGRNTEFLHVNREMYEQFGRELFRTLDRGGVFRCEFRMRHKDGTIFLTEHTVTQIFDSAGWPSHVVSVVRDITERKKAEEALRRSEEQLRKLSALLLEAHESERKMVARELHDSIGASLTAVKFGLERKLRAIEQGKPISGARLEDLLALVQGAMKEARRIQQNLRPLVLDELGVGVAIRSLCRDFQKIYPHIEISDDLHIQEDDVPYRLKIVIYRISQEALNNVAKHSQANAVTLSLRKVKGHIELAIHDNGLGFDLEQEPQSGRRHFGLGLASMKERTQLTGGSFTPDSRKGEGTTIHARWPCN